MILRSKDKNALIRIFSSLKEPLAVWAYGSRVSGTAHAGSDLDLVIRTDGLQKLSLKVLLEVKDKIKESNIPIPVEIFDWARLPESFHQNINAEHEVLFSSLGIIANEPSEKYKKKDD